jgi:release factor glutamine methyltransferase
VTGRCEKAPSTVGDAPSAVGDAPNTVGDAPSTVGEAPNTVGDAPSTTGDALRWGAQALAPAVPRPHSEAERLLAFVCHQARTALLAHPEWSLTAKQAAAFAAAVHQRARGVPLPYILGKIEFFGLTFTVTPDVLIPRPETELLVERALIWLARHRAATIVDVGTGSGCIAIALASQYPAQRILAIDRAIAALRVAQTNARRHHCETAITLIHGDLLTPIGAPVDLVLSNPPYVADPEWAALPASVRREPADALLGGPEGLGVIRRLLAQARSRLAQGGCLLMEIGEKQGNAVRALAQTAFPDAAIAIQPDLAGKDRVLEVFT